jgi:hypothetical protein
MGKGEILKEGEGGAKPPENIQERVNLSPESTAMLKCVIL